MVTPDLKLGDNGALVHVDLGAGRRRLGASALAQAYSQLGDSCPDVAPGHLKAMWETTQSLIAAGRVSAGHDISDGGIATTLLEMGFAGMEGMCEGGGRSSRQLLSLISLHQLLSRRVIRVALMRYHRGMQQRTNPAKIEFPGLGGPCRAGCPLPHSQSSTLNTQTHPPLSFLHSPSLFPLH